MTQSEPENPNARPFDAVAVTDRVKGLECSITPAVRAALGTGLSWQERVAGVQLAQDRVTVEFFSDGMNLSAKVAVEEFIVEELKKRYPHVEKWLVYMKRKEQKPTQASNQASKTSVGASARPSEGTAAGSGQAAPEPRSEPEGRQKLAGTKKSIEGVKRIIAVASGKGGVGKSTVSVNLAVALHNQGYSVGLLDADIYGPSIPMMLGITDDPQVNSKNKIVPPQRNGIKVMSFGFFAGEDSAVIWRGPMIMKALQQFFYDVDWGELDFLVIDLPPGTGDAQLTLVQSLPVDGAVIVTTPQNVALLDAVKGVVMFQKTEVPVLGVVENMSTFHCPSCGAEHNVFGAGGAETVSHKYKVPVLGQIPLNGNIRHAGDAGEPLAFQNGHPVRVRFAEIAEKVVQRIIELERIRKQQAAQQSVAGGPVSPLVAKMNAGSPGLSI